MRLDINNKTTNPKGDRMKDIMAGIDLHSNNLMLARVRLFLSVSRLIVRMKKRSVPFWHLYFFGMCIIKQFVKNDLPNSNQSKNQPSLDECFASRPHLRQRLFKIAEMIDQGAVEGCTAHEAEARAIEQIRKLGQEILNDWAEKSEPHARQKAQAQNPKLIQYGKKNA
jgi:hypothetical protein